MSVNNYLHIAAAFPEDDIGWMAEEATVGLRSLLSELVDYLRGQSGELSAFLAGAVALSLLLCAFELLGGERSRLYLPGGLTLMNFALGVSLVGVIDGLVESGQALANLFSGLVPLMTSVSLSLGYVRLAAAESLGLTLTMALLGGGGQSLLSAMAMPLMIPAMLHPLTSEGGFDIGGAIGYIFTRGMGILTFLLGGVISLQTVVASCSDSLTLRATRVAVSGSLPLVGSAVGGALSQLVGGLGYAGGVLGTYSVVALLSLALGPLTVALIYRMTLTLCCWFLRASGADRSLSAMNALRGALDGAVGVFALTLAVYVLEAVAFMKALPTS